MATVGNLFTEGVIDKLPDIIPTASMSVVKGFLEVNGLSPTLPDLTVRKVVNELTMYRGVKDGK